jgi:hypothetical protein
MRNRGCRRLCFDQLAKKYCRGLIELHQRKFHELLIARSIMIVMPHKRRCGMLMKSIWRIAGLLVVTATSAAAHFSEIPGRYFHPTIAMK